MGKLNIAFIYLFCLMYFEVSFFGGENEVCNIVHKITFGFSKRKRREEMFYIHICILDCCLYRMHYLHMADCFKSVDQNAATL